MADIKQTNAVSIHPGDTILIDNAPCKVMSTQKSKPGKHGASKVRIVAMGILDGKKRDFVTQGQGRIDIPIITKRAAQILSITGENANVMDMETYETFDLAIPEELKEIVKEGIQVVYWLVMDTKIMKQIRGAEESVR